MALRIAETLAIANANAVVDALDAGSGAGKIRVYSGTIPTNPQTAVGAQVLLVEFTLGDPAFGAAGAVSGGALATANAIAAVNAVATNTAAWFRALDSDNTAVFDGTVTATGGGGDLTIQSLSIVNGTEVSVTSLTYTQPKGY